MADIFTTIFVSGMIHSILSNFESDAFNLGAMIGKNLCFIIINEVLPTFKDKFYAGIQKGLGCQRSWSFF